MSPGRVIPAAVLIIVGALLLLNNFGLLPWEMWRHLWRLWPVLLIALGIHIVVGKRYPRLGALLIIALILGSAVASATLLPLIPAPGAKSLSLPREGVSEAAVKLGFGAGELYMEALPSASPNLLEAEFTGRPARVDRKKSGGKLFLELHPVRSVERSGEWRLKFHPELPLKLELRVGAARAVLDLEALKVNYLKLEAGAGSIALTLPRRAGNVRATVRAGAADIKVTIPQGVAARIKVRQALGTVDVDRERFPRRGDYFISPDFDRATDRADLTIEGGLASIEVR